MIQAKRIILTGMAAVMVFVAAGTAWGGEPFRHRQKRQLDRIYQGIRQGEISQSEYARLNRELMRIETARDRAMADGRMSRHERRRLKRMFNRADRHIHYARENRTGHGFKGADGRYGRF